MLIAAVSVYLLFLALLLVILSAGRRAREAQEEALYAEGYRLVDGIWRQQEGTRGHLLPFTTRVQ